MYCLLFCFSVELEFIGNYTFIVAKIGLVKLQEGMKKTIVESLDVEEWRVRNVKCREGSIITTFEFLPPDEGIHDNATMIFKSDIQKLKTAVETGTLIVMIGDDIRIYVNRNRTMTWNVITVPRAGPQGGGTSLLALYIFFGVAIVIASLGLSVYLSIKYELIPRAYVNRVFPQMYV